MKSSSANLFWVVVVLAALWVFGTHERGRPAPDFALQGAYGGRYHLDSFRGKPVLLVFWTTSCPICRHELPIVNNILPEAMRKGVEVAGVNIGDVDGAREVLRPYHLLNLVDSDGTAARNYRVSGVPKLVLIGSDGKIAHAAAGFQSADTLLSWMP
ncbi:MAG: TlpA disulfide reductase family protein [Bryobacteraceae bacterium]